MHEISEEELSQMMRECCDHDDEYLDYGATFAMQKLKDKLNERGYKIVKGAGCQKKIILK